MNATRCTSVFQVHSDFRYFKISICLDDLCSSTCANFRFSGDLFLRTLKACIIPMIVTSLISSMAAMPGNAAGRMGGVAVAYYLSTTIVAVIIGAVLVTTIRPGEREDLDNSDDEKRLIEPVDSLLDLIRFV